MYHQTPLRTKRSLPDVLSCKGWSFPSPFKTFDFCSSPLFSHSAPRNERQSCCQTRGSRKIRAFYGADFPLFFSPNLFQHPPLSPESYGAIPHSRAASVDANPLSMFTPLLRFFPQPPIFCFLFLRVFGCILRPGLTPPPRDPLLRPPSF